MIVTTVTDKPRDPIPPPPPPPEARIAVVERPRPRVDKRLWFLLIISLTLTLLCTLLFLQMQCEEEQNRLKRSMPTISPGTVEAMSFIGTKSVLEVTSNDTLAPWHPTNPFGLDWLEYTSWGVVVKKPGLYFIFAQIHYIAFEPTNTYIIVRHEKGRQHHIASCSKTWQGPKAPARPDTVNCYTSVVQMLDTGDSVYLVQKEEDRKIIFTHDHSYWGIVRLGEHYYG